MWTFTSHLQSNPWKFEMLHAASSNSTPGIYFVCKDAWTTVCSINTHSFKRMNLSYTWWLGEVSTELEKIEAYITWSRFDHDFVTACICITYAQDRMSAEKYGNGYAVGGSQTSVHHLRTAWGLVQTQVAGPHRQSVWFSRSGVRSENAYF